MAEYSEEWVSFEMARDDWNDAVVALEQAKVRERNARWKLNEAAENLEKQGRT
jgi:hypothetical protein